MASAPVPKEGQKKRLRLLGSMDISIKLLVGRDETPIMVHKTFLCAHSEFFTAACEPEQMDPENRVIKLSEDDLQAVSAMITWIYLDRIFIPRDPAEFTYEEFNFEDHVAYLSSLVYFSKLYILGEKYQIPRLRNHVADAIYLISSNEGRGVKIPATLIKFVYENTSRESSLRMIIIMLFIENTDTAKFRKDGVSLPSDVLHDLALHYITEEYEGLDDDFCERFHKHAPGDDTDLCEEQRKYIYD